MRNYLSFGGGVNSVALHLFMLDQGIEFESVFVNHGTDWPETYQYVAGFQWWLKANGYPPITILRPLVQNHTTLIGYYEWKRKVPSIMRRDCTDKFKIRTLQRYQKAPCFVHLGIDAGEAKRARISTRNGMENRYLLIEHDIDREGCVKIIKDHGLPIPMKSGCYICPFQKRSQWIDLRKKHPCLFQRADNLEAANIEDRIANGKSGFTLLNSGKTLPATVDEKQRKLWQEDEYPPCNCFL